MSLVIKSSRRRSTDTVVGLQQVFNFANFYWRSIQSFSVIATSLIAILKTTGLFVALVFKIDDNELVGSGDATRAESGRRVGRSDASKKSQTESGLNCMEYSEDEKGVYPSCRSQRAGLIAEKTPTKDSVEYADFAFSQKLASELPKHTGINDYAIKLVDANGFIRLSKSSTGAPIFFKQIALVMHLEF